MLLKILATYILLIYGVDSLQLKKVLVLSRHNLRSPLSDELERYTPKQWPKWNALPGNLTPKGYLLEGYMGEYISTWLEDKELFSPQDTRKKSKCPNEKSVYIFSNCPQRTIDTAKAFTESAFPNCNISVHFNHTFCPGFDSMFYYVINNSTEAYKLEGEREMREKLDKSHLQDLFAIVNNIADVKYSKVCKNDGICDLNKGDYDIVFRYGSPPSITGRFAVAKAMVDAFLMSFYEGFSLEDVAWGQIKNEDQWKTITKILDVEQDVRFNLTLMRDIIKPFMKFMKKEFDDVTKFSFISGHDATIRVILTPLGIKAFVLPEQFETTPIGGKMIFQKWTDGAKDFLKIEYVYPSWRQIRDAEKLSIENPPKNITVYLKSCVADDNGFCPWSDFEKILYDLAI